MQTNPSDIYQLAPIILFAYNRPEHTQAVLEALAMDPCAEISELFVFCDGPKPGSSMDTINRIMKVRQIIRSRLWCGSVDIIERDHNLGLSASIIDGVGQVMSRYGRAIILEDDLVPSPGFIDFMNAALDYFCSDDRVAGVSGWNHGIREIHAPYFSRSGSCWGWGTWSRVWENAVFDAKLWQKVLSKRNLAYYFDLNGSYPFYRMLAQQAEGHIDSWAICFYASYFMKKQLFLYPAKSFITNIGEDGSGRHSKWKMETVKLVNLESVNNNLNQTSEIQTDLVVMESNKIRNLIIRKFRKEQSISKKQKWMNRIQQLMHNYHNHPI